jgi:hypothetical protein
VKSSFFTGYCEGYYGRLSDFEQRRQWVRALADSGGSVYLYGPKEDPYHRQEWRKTYPAAFRKDFYAFVAYSRQRKVEVVASLAPGLSYRYSNSTDYKTLWKKIAGFLEMGCRQVALLMDDIPNQLPKEAIGTYTSLGQAHADLLHRLDQDIKRKNPQASLWFCPTIYCDRFADQGKAESDGYLRDLAKGSPADICVMWTGSDVISPTLRRKDFAGIRAHFGDRILVWDNFYANDYCPGKVFLGPLQGRGIEVARNTRGWLLNPTGLPETDAFLFAASVPVLAGQAPKTAWRKACEKSDIPAPLEKLLDFLGSPFGPAGLSQTSSVRIASLRKILKPLIWDWKGALHREWYPYLYSLDAELRFLEQSENARDAVWIRKKFSPILADWFLRPRV